jgi:hypothetical protein
MRERRRFRRRSREAFPVRTQTVGCGGAPPVERKRDRGLSDGKSVLNFKSNFFLKKKKKKKKGRKKERWKLLLN